MVVAQVEAWFSRAIAPTRRISVGELRLPAGDGAASGVEAAAMLLGGMAARYSRDLDEDDLAELHRLVRDVELGRRIPQPRLRHRFQADRVGLQRCTHRLVQDRGGFLHLDLDQHRGTPEQQSLAAVYVARSLPPARRPGALGAIRRGMQWRGDLGPELLGHLRLGAPSGHLGPAAGAADPTAWAVSVLNLTILDGHPGRDEVRAAFRESLRAVHPDHGAAEEGAAERIAELDVARRILLG